MHPKKRVTVTIDEEFVEAGQRAVTEGRAASLSAWVNTAIERQVEHESGLAALAQWVCGWEAEHGPITAEDIAAAEQEMEARTIHVGRRDVA